MKKAASLAIGTAGLAALAAVPAIAASTTGASHGSKIVASASPSKAGTKAKPRSVKIHTVFTTQPPAQGQPGFATSRTVVHLPRGLKLNASRFKACSAAILNASGPTGCPTGSKVGSGNATGLALGQQENLTVTAFNGQKGKQLLLYVQGNAPLQINSTIVGTVKPDRGKYGYKLDVVIPPSLQQPLSGVYATLTRFETTIGGVKSKGVGYIVSSACSKKTWHWGADLTFTDGTTDKTTTTSKCS